jgi:hypothetical protein
VVRWEYRKKNEKQNKLLISIFIIGWLASNTIHV